MSNASASPRILGSVREENGAGTIRVEDVYDTDIDDLWSAITQPERLARWVVKVTGDVASGGDFGLEITSGWQGFGRVDICEAPRRLRVTSWSDEDAPGVIEATLAEEGGGTRLVIEESGLPLDVYPAHGAGWQAHIEDLGDYLAGRERRDWRSRWKELSAPYWAMIGR
jgi:uncharacterized protein YndB with AHSA1/START domain